MIAVIADDFTGAAEIGGVGLRHGLKVVIETRVEKEEDADLLIIAADTRTLSAERATMEIESLTKQLLALNPRYIYKKLDSVLRGNIADELMAQMKISGKERSIIIAGNPTFNRLIKNGVYYIENVPLAETSFAKDKEYTIKSSSVIELIGTERNDVKSIHVDQEVPKSGLIVGDVSNIEDMRRWRDTINEDTLAAGGAGFFDILLEKDSTKEVKHPVFIDQLGHRILFVFGSAFPKSKLFLKSLQNSNIFISNMPDGIYREIKPSASLVEEWVNEIVDKVNQNIRVVVTISHSGSTDKDISFRIREAIGQLVKKVVERIELNDILIEGGATASVIFNYLNITRLYPFQEIEAGVIQMKAPEYPNLFITTKPGSYIWPENILKQC